MVKVVRSVVVDKPVADAFSFVAKDFFSNLHLWNPALIEVRKLSEGPVGKGTYGREVQRIMGRPYERRFVVSEYEPDRRFAFQSTEPPSKEAYRSSYAFEEAGGESKTQLTFDFEYESPSFWFRALGPLVGRAIRKDVERNLELLKASVEQQGR